MEGGRLGADAEAVLVPAMPGPADVHHDPAMRPEPREIKARGSIRGIQADHDPAMRPAPQEIKARGSRRGVQD